MSARLLFMTACLAAIGLAPLGAQNLDADLQRAKQREATSGDCKSVLTEYMRIAEQGARTNRTPAAEALLRAALCHEREGRTADAGVVYARLLRDFSDVGSFASEARRRIDLLPNGRGANAGSGSRAESTRLVWTLPDASMWLRQGSISPNGRYVAVSTSGGGLMLRDLVNSRDRVVVRPSPGDFARVGDIAFSRDGRRLVFEAISDVDVSLGLRIIDLDEPGLPTPRGLLNADAMPCDWSPDGNLIAARIRNVEKPLPARRDPLSPWQLVLVSVRDGSVRVLKTVQARYRSRTSAAFSTDGRSVAFEVPESGAGVRDIVVMSVDGSGEDAGSTAKGDDALLGWAPDGSGLLFTSTRGGGSQAIWLQRFLNGRREGAPALIRKDGPASPLALASDGALYSFVDNDGGVSVKTATFDTAAGRFQTAIEDVPSTFVRSSRRPRWSPDGKLLGYISLRGDRGGDVFVTRDLGTGDTRETPLDIYFRNGNRNLWYWVPDNRSILTIAEDPDPAVGVGLFRTELSSGRTSLMVARNLGTQTGRNLPEWSADGRTLHYSYATGPGTYVRVARDLQTGDEKEIPRNTDPQSPDGTKSYLGRRMPDGVAVLERDVSSGDERELLKLIGYSDWSLTRDGKAIIALTTDLKTNESQAVVRSIAEGNTKTIFRSARGQRVVVVAASAPDERSVFLQVADSTGAVFYWWAPIDGRPARLLEELSGYETVGWEFHPDGRRVALQINHRRTFNNQIFVLENFLPAARR